MCLNSMSLAKERGTMSVVQDKAATNIDPTIAKMSNFKVQLYKVEWFLSQAEDLINYFR